MPLKIHNSLTKTKEELKPLVPGEIKMYVCGPTVYDEPHIGHLRSAYIFDTMRRYLEYSGFKVRFVRNVTDVDDKIIEKAKAAGGTDLVAETQSVSKKYYDLYAGALNAIGLRAPDVEPRATGHIPEMIRLIETLIQKGAAYASGGDVYFSVGGFAAYGSLSHQNTDQMLENNRVDPNEKKKNPLDFALWKLAKPGEPSWPSPWGAGRPGWHIECSAMSMKYLGETFDIHGGGRDLLFPHHENEIAQSSAATGKPFANLWIHHGLITVNEQKMSKSLKNYVTLETIQKESRYGVEELKFLFLGTHYAAPLDYSFERMRMEKAVRERFVYFFEELEASPDSAAAAKPSAEADRYEAEFREAMDDDFNTPKALAVLHEMIHAARQSKDASARYAIGARMKKLGGIFGLFLGAASNGHDAAVETKVAERAAAKKLMDYKKADAIRDELEKQGIAIKDMPDGTTRWRRI